MPTTGRKLRVSLSARSRNVRIKEIGCHRDIRFHIQSHLLSTCLLASTRGLENYFQGNGSNYIPIIIVILNFNIEIISPCFA